jgi:hypothetical protein
MNEQYQKPHDTFSPETPSGTSENSTREGLGLIAMLKAAVQRRKDRERITYGQVGREPGYYVTDHFWPIDLMGEFDEEDRKHGPLADSADYLIKGD